MMDPDVIFPRVGRMTLEERQAWEQALLNDKKLQDEFASEQGEFLLLNDLVAKAGLAPEDLVRNKPATMLPKYRHIFWFLEGIQARGPIDLFVEDPKLKRALRKRCQELRRIIQKKGIKRCGFHPFLIRFVCYEIYDRETWLQELIDALPG